MKSVTRAITEAIDDRERLQNTEAPPVDGMGIHTAGMTITTDVPTGEPADDDDIAPEELDVEMDVVAPDFDPSKVDEPEDDEEITETFPGYQDPPEAKAVHGGMSRPGKMPCITYSMLAGATCPQGRKLAQIPGSVCYGCYAHSGNYGRPNVVKAMVRRANLTRQALKNPSRLEAWIEAIILSIDSSGDDVFRWHDSGDIMGQGHLEAIVEIARRVPRVRFWLPTKEHGTVSSWLGSYGVKAIPRNLNIRLSAHTLFDTVRPIPGTTASSVMSGEGYKCPATWDEEYLKRFRHTCGPCRACWDRKIKNVDYHYHGAQYRYRQGLLVHGLKEPAKGVPEKPKGWTPAPAAQAKAMKLPQTPGPVKKIIRPD